MWKHLLSIYFVSLIYSSVSFILAVSCILILRKLNIRQDYWTPCQRIQWPFSFRTEKPRLVHISQPTNKFGKEYHKEWSDQVIDSLDVAAGWMADSPDEEDPLKHLIEHMKAQTGQDSIQSEMSCLLRCNKTSLQNIKKWNWQTVHPSQATSMKT